MKRAIDFAAAGLGLAVLGLPMLAIAALIRLTSPGPAVYWSQRVGANNALFAMPKFRTMRIDTPEVATHLLVNPGQWVTPIGRVLRRLSLDELPQLWSVLRGDMSLVGPRPALHSQKDLISLRTAVGVHRLRPGVTGWAQINGRDELPIEEKLKFDWQYLKRRSTGFDLYVLAATVAPVLTGRGVRH
ncbi:MAG: lipid carrier--UDP-N-acetylgalactosaminyltransferase [Caulobacterales bacterium 68-7]|nr:sugar transferase [Caulobacterales bacterium]OJU13596.1 MAG: lipid carrier--UDP-N-acetylgalactosaminyltransferase [Caulobacterales bacterium 68-7]